MKLIDDVAGVRANAAAGTQADRPDAARYLLTQGQWFLLLPGGVTVGPFATRRAAEIESTRLQRLVPDLSPEANDERAPVLRGYVVEELAALDSALLSRLLRLVPPAAKR
jgi:hypothetical protein